MSEQAYLNLMRDILVTGEGRPDRTQVGTSSLFGRQLRFDLRAGFPLLTTKKVHFKSVAVELLSFIRGDRTTDFMKSHGVSIWDEWAKGSIGNWLGPIYGVQWRGTGGSWLGRDQLQDVIREINKNPYSRRLLVSAWNVEDLDQMALPPCHFAFQFYVSKPRMPENLPRLSCHVSMRSADIFLGVPFNIASYALLTHMICNVVCMLPGDLIFSFGDVHLYNNHTNQAREQLARLPKVLPWLNIHNAHVSIDDFKLDEFEVVGYDPHPAIKAPIAV